MFTSSTLSTMIIGIALVVDELHKGPRLVCRYPPSIPSNILNFESSNLLKYHSEYLSITPENFAKLFRPKLAICSQVIELTINDLYYISFPCPCPATNDDNSRIISLFNIVITTVKLKNIQYQQLNCDPIASNLGLEYRSVNIESIRRFKFLYA